MSEGNRPQEKKPTYQLPAYISGNGLYNRTDVARLCWPGYMLPGVPWFGVHPLVLCGIFPNFSPQKQMQAFCGMEQLQFCKMQKAGFHHHFYYGLFPIFSA